jgi:ABC-type phosphate transport system substrate-binding protein
MVRNPGINYRAGICAAVVSLMLTVTGGTATEEVVVVVSPSSMVRSLSKAQVADIFLGKARRFPDGTVAQPVDQVEGSAARNAFYATFADRSPAQVKSHWSKIIFTGRGQPPLAIANTAELKRRIAANPAAIGYLDRRQVDASVRVVR